MTFRKDKGGGRKLVIGMPIMVKDTNT
jgi:hypothetical protein